jgi:hypothetical protein
MVRPEEDRSIRTFVFMEGVRPPVEPAFFPGRMAAHVRTMSGAVHPLKNSIFFRIAVHHPITSYRKESLFLYI